MAQTPTMMSHTVAWLFSLVAFCGCFTVCILPLNSNDPTLALILHVGRRRLRHFAAEVSLNYVEREIDAGSQTTCGRDLLVLHKAQAALETNVGKRLRKLIEELVMRGSVLAGKQARLAKLKRARAN